jgi:predicted transcriptional regulator
MNEVKQTFFGGSFSSLVSFFAKEEKLTDDDISEILRIIEKKNS